MFFQAFQSLQIFSRNEYLSLTAAQCIKYNSSISLFLFFLSFSFYFSLCPYPLPPSPPRSPTLPPSRDKLSDEKCGIGFFHKSLAFGRKNSISNRLEVESLSLSFSLSIFLGHSIGGYFFQEWLVWKSASLAWPLSFSLLLLFQLSDDVDNDNDDDDDDKNDVDDNILVLCVRWKRVRMRVFFLGWSQFIRGDAHL